MGVVRPLLPYKSCTGTPLGPLDRTLVVVVEGLVREVVQALAPSKAHGDDPYAAAIGEPRRAFKTTV